MNVAFFLIPKQHVVWIPTNATTAEAFLRMEESGYTAIPMLDEEGRYVGTITEGDLLRHVMYSKQDASGGNSEQVRVAEVPLRAKIAAVEIGASVEALFDRAIEQNFVPVQDNRTVFIGIVRRREILEHCAGMMREKAAAKE